MVDVGEALARARRQKRNVVHLCSYCVRDRSRKAEPRKGSVYKSPTFWGRANFRYHFIRVEPAETA